MTITNELLTVRQVAQRLNRCERTIRNWINWGWLPAVKPTGYNYWIKEEDLHRLMAGKGERNDSN